MTHRLAFVLALTACSGQSSTSPAPDGPLAADAASSSADAAGSPDAPGSSPVDSPSRPPDAPAADAGPPDAPPALDAMPGPVLTVTKDAQATGSGTITSTPAGLTCGTTCTSASASFAPGTTSVTLEARPAAGSHFQGWSGACAGSYRFCTVAVTASLTATARFATTVDNLAFVTSQTFTGALGGLAGADQKCADAATQAGLTGHFVALLSTATVDARDRLVTAGGQPASGPTLVDGTPLYDSITSVFDDHALWNPVGLDENGYDLANDFQANIDVWTGTVQGGTKDGSRCADWTSAGHDHVGLVGELEGGPRLWLGFRAVGSCDQELRLYCIMTDASLGRVPVATPGKQIYVTKAGFTPGAGISAADQVCADERPQGVTTVKALLTTSSAPASSLLDPIALYVRPDLIPVGTGAEIIQAGHWLRRLPSGIWQNGDGTYVATDTVLAWNGGGAMDVAGTLANTCNDWKSTDGQVWTGFFQRVDFWWWAGSQVACSDSLPLLCVER
jgi:hypothetical protein